MQANLQTALDNPSVPRYLVSNILNYSYRTTITALYNTLYTHTRLLSALLKSYCVWLHPV